MAPRGPKTSPYYGAKKRGLIRAAVDMRRLCPGGGRTQRFELGGFPTDKHAGVGHDLFIVLDGDSSKPLNFPQCREDIALFAEQHGMEFKVGPEEEKGESKWDGDKKKRFMALVEAVYQIIPAEPERAEEIGVADTVQVNNGGTGQGYLTQLQGEGEGEGDPVEPQGDPIEDFRYIDEVLQQTYGSIEMQHHSRESESDVYPWLSNDELQALLSEKDEVIFRLTAELKELKDFKAKALLSIEALAVCAGAFFIPIVD